MSERYDRELMGYFVGLFTDSWLRPRPVLDRDKLRMTCKLREYTVCATTCTVSFFEFATPTNRLKGRRFEHVHH